MLVVGGSNQLSVFTRTIGAWNARDEQEYRCKIQAIEMGKANNRSGGTLTTPSLHVLSAVNVWRGKMAGSSEMDDGECKEG
jgi:hypothetical protein